jgi:hypothetical protein
VLEKQRRISLEPAAGLGEFSNGSAVIFLSINKDLVPNIMVIRAFDLALVVLLANPPSSCATSTPLRHPHVFQQDRHVLDVGGSAPHSRHGG